MERARTERARTDFVVGLGSSVGSREAFVRLAIALLNADPRVEVVARSPRYVTPPLGPSPQDFVNAAVRVRTELPPRALLELTRAIEARLGRVRDVRWGPRTIDLDLLYWEGGEVREPELVVPHPRLRERGFALAPLLAVAPELGGRFGADLDRVGAPKGEAWTEAAEVAGAIEVRALDDADALALALTAAGGGTVGPDVRAVPAPSAQALAAARAGAVAIDALEPGGAVRARITGDARPGLAPAVALLEGGRCRLRLEAAQVPGM